MVKCSHCDEVIPYLPFRCKYCGNFHCKNHRLPENHDCTFEFKHVPKLMEDYDISKKAPTAKEIGQKRLYKEGDALSEKQLKKFYKRKEKEHKERMKQTYSLSRFRSEKLYGTKLIIVLIVIFTIISIAQVLNPYILLSPFALNNFFFHTFLTSMFVISIGDPLFGFFILLLLIMIIINFGKTIELRYGTRFILLLYIISCSISALLYLLFNYMYALVDPSILLYLFGIGTAWAGLMGLMSFLIFFRLDAEMSLLIFFFPIRMKGKILLIFLIAFNAILGAIYLLNPNTIPLAFSQFAGLGGILGGYLLFRYVSK